MIAGGGSARLAFTVALLLGGAPGASAVELWSRGDASLEFSGSARQLVVTSPQTDAEKFEEALLEEVGAGNPDCIPPGVLPGPAPGDFAQCPAWKLVGEDQVVQSLTRLRMRLDARATSWLSGVLVWDNQLAAGELDTLERAISENFTADTFLGAEWNLYESDVVLLQSIVYRGYIRLESDHLEAMVGRQRIAWGNTRLWNPTDRFNAIPPLAIQADQSAGIDSVVGRWYIDGFHSVEAVYAPGTSRDEARFGMRVRGVAFDTDWTLLGGVFERDPAIGFDLARNLGDAAIRTEVIYTAPDRKVWPVGEPHPRELDDFWQVVAGIDYTFDVGRGLYVLLEHLYNGNALGFGRGLAGSLLIFFRNDGQPATAAITGGSQVVTGSSNLTGLQLGMEFLGELRGDLLTIGDWDGGSVVFFPAVTYSPLDWLELRAGGQFGVGPRRSEYGNLGQTGFLQLDFYF